MCGAEMRCEQLPYRATGHYDPATGGGDKMQAYFTDMLLDTDRNLQYFRAISAAIQEFKDREGRSPVVLDAGCGTGFLTACALYAGADHVVAVDVSPSHVHALRANVHPYENVTPLLAHKYFEKPVAFDMLIAELLGVCSNSESARRYMKEYAEHMTVHPSGRQYIVPQRVVQTVCRFKPPRMPADTRRDVASGLVPTNHIGMLYWLAPPPPSTGRMEVRHDDFVNSFECTLPQHELSSGTYAVEWVAHLWGGVTLENTWHWAHTHRQDRHSRVARSRAWGLMLFGVPYTATVNSREPPVARYPEDATEPDIRLLRNGRLTRPLQVRARDATEDDMTFFRRPDAVSNTEELSRIASRLETSSGTQRRTHKDHVHTPGFVAMTPLWKGFPAPFRALLYQTTVLPVARVLRSVDAWAFTTHLCLCLPFLYEENRATEMDVPIEMITPRLSKAYNAWLVVGTLFRLPPGAG